MSIIVLELYTKITEVDLSAFAYRLFHDDFSSILGAKCSSEDLAPRIEEKSSWNSL